jgi:hypothetical protein
MNDNTAFTITIWAFVFFITMILYFSNEGQEKKLQYQFAIECIKNWWEVLDFSCIKPKQ